MFENNKDSMQMKETKANPWSSEPENGTPKQMDQKFNHEKNEIILDIEFMKQEVETLQDPQQIRQMLKQLSY